MALLAPLAFGMPSGMEWIIVGVIALLLFGRRLPEVMRGLGGGVREFRKGLESGHEDDETKKEPRHIEGKPEEVSTSSQAKAPSERES